MAPRLITVLLYQSGHFRYRLGNRFSKGRIGGRQLPDPLEEGVDVMTGSAGKTFSGPRSGILVWDGLEIAEALTGCRLRLRRRIARRSPRGGLLAILTDVLLLWPTGAVLLRR